MKLSETQMEAILSPVQAPPETFISFPVEAALARGGNLDTYVATSFVLPPKYVAWKRFLNKVNPPPDFDQARLQMTKQLGFINHWHIKKNKRRKKL
jgi:hypothetical protein